MSEIMEGATDIGYGVLILFTSWRKHAKAGILHEHPTPDGDRHMGGIKFDLPGVAEAFPGDPLWTVESWEPLTLSPSLRCRDCGHHGWIRSGRWEPA
jgi:hypothetical protein